MGKTKIVYKDDNSTKLIFGNVEDEDDVFIKIKAEDGTKFRVNKSSIVTIKELGDVKNGLEKD